MKSDIRTIYEMDVTNEELYTIRCFCSFLDDVYSENSADDEIVDIVKAIARYSQRELENLNVVINIIDSEEED